LNNAAAPKKPRLVRLSELTTRRSVEDEPSGDGRYVLPVRASVGLPAIRSKFSLASIYGVIFYRGEARRNRLQAANDGSGSEPCRPDCDPAKVRLRR